MAASSALRRNKHSDYLEIDDSINNRNNKTTRFNVARDNNLNCIIYKFIQKDGFKKIQQEKAKDLNQNEIQEKLDKNFSSKPLVKKL